MPPRGRLPSRRVSRVSRKGKVSRPENPQQWDKLLSKAGLKLALVLFVVSFLEHTISCTLAWPGKCSLEKCEI